MGLLRTAVIMSVFIVLAACSSAKTGVVARVNDVAISEADYLRELERRRVGSNAASDEALKAEVLETMIRQELINQGAPSLGVTVTEADVQMEYDNLRSLSESEADWNNFLATNHYTEAEILTAQHDVLMTQRVQLVLMEDYLGSVEQVNARHIVVRTREEAETVLDRLNNGEGFASLAAEYSIDTTTREIGGNLGWFARNELFYKNLEDIAFQLETGQIAGPIATSLGYHVIQTMDKAVRPIESERLPMLSENIFSSWLDEQYRNATIERYQ